MRKKKTLVTRETVRKLSIKKLEEAAGGTTTVNPQSRVSGVGSFNTVAGPGCDNPIKLPIIPIIPKIGF